MSDWSDDDALASEYVLGTLPQDERGIAEDRLLRDPAFATLVSEWTSRLAPLLEITPAVEPDVRVRDAVLRDIDRLRAERPVTPDGSGTVVMLRRQVTRWRVATALCGSLAALLAIWLATSTYILPNQPGSFMAVLQQGTGAPAFLVSLDIADRRMVVVPVGTSPAPDKSYELWMIGSDAAGPRPIGLVDTPSATPAALPDVSSELISKATYAVTIEPKGGSPSGKPTSAPVFTGRLVELAPASAR